MQSYNSIVDTCSHYWRPVHWIKNSAMTLFFLSEQSTVFFFFIKIINQRYYCDHTMSFYVFLHVCEKKHPLMWYKVKCFTFFFSCNILFVVVRLSQRHHPFKTSRKYVHIYGAWPYKKCSTHCFEYQCGYNFVVLSLPNQSKRGLCEQVFFTEIIY